MFYTLIVLVFGIYLGQEYPRIPSIKTTLQIVVNNLNKISDNDGVEKKEDINYRSVNDNIEIKISPRRHYYSLPIWVSNWLSWSGAASDSGEIIEQEKTE